MIILPWEFAPRRIRRLAILLSVAIAAAMICAGHALAVPKARSAEECQFVADMAVTAAALAKEGVELKKAEAIMHRIYLLTEQRGVPILRAMLVVVYRDKPEPMAFLQAISGQCLRSEGDLDAILGADS